MSSSINIESFETSYKKLFESNHTNQFKKTASKDLLDKFVGIQDSRFSIRIVQTVMISILLVLMYIVLSTNIKDLIDKTVTDVAFFSIIIVYFWYSTHSLQEIVDEKAKALTSYFDNMSILDEEKVATIEKHKGNKDKDFSIEESETV